MKFSEIKDKIKNLGNFKSLSEIKKAGLRICRNTKTGDYWLIEEEFLKPVIKSPRECKSISTKSENLKYKILICHRSKNELKNTCIVKYIKWGEKKKYNTRPTCKNKKFWYDLGTQDIAYCSYPMVNNDRLIFALNNGLLNDANLVGVYPKKDYGNKLAMTLNATYNMINMELFGIANLGEGAIKQNPVYIKNFAIILNPELIPESSILINRKIKSIFSELNIDPLKPIRSQQPNPLPDRKELDDIVFDALGLTEQERKEIYWAVCELVKNRLEKAKSF